MEVSGGQARLIMAIALGVLVGVVLGLTGAGGGILAVPLLMYGVGWSLTQAAPVALIAVSLAAALGASIAWRYGWVRYRAALLMGAMGAATAPLGILLATHLQVRTLTLVFAVTMLISAARLWRQMDDSHGLREPMIRLSPETGRFIWTFPTLVTISAIGAITGVVAGALGVGGGFILVPALRLVTLLPMQSAIATSLMVIALISGSTVAGALISGYDYPWQFAGPFAAGSMAGMLAGRAIAPRIAGVRLQKAFALLMVLVAIGFVFKTSS